MVTRQPATNNLSISGGFTQLPRRVFYLCIAGCWLLVLNILIADDREIRHVTVYREDGRFGGWPANHGIWNWDNEILVGFSRGYHKDRKSGHNIDHDKPEEHVLARSLDAGETWALEHPNSQGMLLGVGPALHGTPLPGVTPPLPKKQTKPIDFTNPNLALTVRMSGVNVGPSRYYVSLDRGRSWSPPYRLPLFGQLGIAARTDYLVSGPRDCFLFLTASKSNGHEGRPLCVRTTDGGLTWKRVSWIGPEPSGLGDFAIMPSTIRLNGNELLTSCRTHEGLRRWIDTYRSLDNGRSWQFNGKGAEDTGTGNPPSMIQLADERICLTYGYRAEPYGIRARISANQGNAWGKEIILRHDGSGVDLGYPRSVQRPDGKVVTVYYFQDQLDPYRHIAATIWKP